MPRRPATHDVALAEFRYQLRRFLRISEDAARAAGLEPQQHQLLLAISGAPAGETPTVAYLAERLQLKHHSIVGLLDRLERRTLVRRRRDQDDRRHVVAELTASGRAVLHRLSVFHQRELRSLAPTLRAAMNAILGPDARSRRTGA
jgi:DNA-binding MarR family transcriptional regulator